MGPHDGHGPDSPIEALLRDAARGDARAWSQIVARYTPRLYGLFASQIGDPDWAEEMTQATLVKLVESLSQPGAYRERGRFEPWLFRVAMNLLRDELRRRKRQARPADMSPGEHGGEALGLACPAGDGPDEAAARAEDLIRLRAAVASLGQADRQVLHLRHTAGLSFAEIAQTLDQPLGTVLARAHRAVKKLRDMMEPGAQTAGAPTQKRA